MRALCLAGVDWVRSLSDVLSHSTALPVHPGLPQLEHPGAQSASHSTCVPRHCRHITCAPPLRQCTTDMPTKVS